MNRILRVLPGVLVACAGLSAAPLQAATSFDAQVLGDALSDRRDGEVYRAIAQLQKILEEAPDADRVKLELAVAYLQAGIYDEAERLANEVLETEDLPDAVKDNVEKFNELVSERKSAAEESPHSFSYEFSLFVGDDDNVNNGINADVLDSGLAVNPAFQDRDATLTATRVAVNHVYRSPSSGEFRGKPSKMSIESQAYFYNKFHSGDDVDDFELTVLSFGTGPVLRVSNGTTLQAKVRADYIEQGGDYLATFYSLMPGVSVPVGPGSVKVDGIIQAREYGSNASSDLQGQRYGLGFAYELPLLRGMRAKAGYFFYTQTAEQSRFEHDADGYQLDWQWRLANAWRLYAQYRHKDADYEGSEPLLGGAARRTEEKRQVAGVDYALNNWLFSVQWMDVDLDANGDAFEYEREVLQAGVTLRVD